MNDYSKNQHKLLGTVICSVDTGIVNVRHRQIKAVNVKEKTPKKMCTVLQQHLNRQNGISSPTENATANGYNTVSVSPSPAGGRAESVALTPAIGGVSSYWVCKILKYI